jgi:DNA polymerase-3 subunit alpha
MDIEQYIKELIKTPEEQTRVEYEMQLYKEFGLQNVLKVLKYIIDLMRKNNIVWGVGRGSSVSSYVLFLMGVHKVDSMKYNLDIKDFLK